MDNFQIFEEAPPERKNGPIGVDWKARLEKIEHLNRWFVIGKWDRPNGAAGAGSRLKKRFDNFVFRSVISEDKKSSRLYAMLIKPRVTPEG